MAWFRSSDKRPPEAPAAARNAPAATPLRVSDYLAPSAIHLLPTSLSTTQAFERLVQSLGLADPTAAVQAVLAREASGATIIAPGLAIPHARLPGLPRIVAALGLCPTGLTAGGQTAPLRVVLLFLSPKEQMREHLMFLAGLSALFQTEGLLEALLQLTTAEAVLGAIRAAESAAP